MVENAISFKLITGSNQYFAVGCHVLLSDKAGETCGGIASVFECQPKETLLLSIGKLDVTAHRE